MRRVPLIGSPCPPRISFLLVFCFVHFAVCIHCPVPSARLRLFCRHRASACSFGWPCSISIRCPRVCLASPFGFCLTLFDPETLVRTFARPRVGASGRTGCELKPGQIELYPSDPESRHRLCARSVTFLALSPPRILALDGPLCLRSTPRGAH